MQGRATWFLFIVLMELTSSCKLFYSYFVINILWGNFYPACLRIPYIHPISWNSVRYKTDLGVKWLEVFTTQSWPVETLRSAFTLMPLACTKGHLFFNQVWGATDGQLWNILFEGDFAHHIGSLKHIWDRIFKFALFSCKTLHLA